MTLYELLSQSPFALVFLLTVCAVGIFATMRLVGLQRLRKEYFSRISELSPDERKLEYAAVRVESVEQSSSLTPFSKALPTAAHIRKMPRASQRMYVAETQQRLYWTRAIATSASILGPAAGFFLLQNTWPMMRDYWSSPEQFVTQVGFWPGIGIGALPVLIASLITSPVFIEWVKHQLTAHYTALLESYEAQNKSRLSQVFRKASRYPFSSTRHLTIQGRKTHK